MSQTKRIRKVGVLTSGGDSPVMNAAIRAVVRSAIFHGLEVAGIRRGYQGMIDDEISEMNTHDVGGIIFRGGTVLRSARSEAFRTVEGRKKAYANLQKHGIDALVVIGGDGSFKGAEVFQNEFGIPCVGAPGTIDNDLKGTDMTIGYDTAVNTAMEAIDKIKDTADAHDRIFIVEVMGRDAGFIALRSGLSTGAEGILVPELHKEPELLLENLNHRLHKRRKSAVIVVAEGDQSGGALNFSEVVQNHFPDADIRVTILGHIQRGGSPTAQDRILASRMGVGAVEALLDGKSSVMIGIVNGKVHHTPFKLATKHHTKLSDELIRLNKILSI